MFSLPARASDAGPDSVRHPATCSVCGQMVPRDCTVPCQGSDDCCERICEDCAELGHEGHSCKCDGCHLYACPEHMVSDGDMRWCGICRAKEVSDVRAMSER